MSDVNLRFLASSLPEYAKDIKLNLTSIENITTLTPQQLWGTALATAIASRNELVLAAMDTEAKAQLTPEAMKAAKGAAALMAMNNVYYRFTHLVEDDNFATMRANLRMNFMRSHGVETADFELWSLAVSAVNGCGQCMTSHVTSVLGEGLSREAIHDAVRVASIIHAVAVTLEGEEHFLAAEHA